LFIITNINTWVLLFKIVTIVCVYLRATGLNPNTNYSISARAVQVGSLMFNASQSPFGNVFNVTTGETFYLCV